MELIYHTGTLHTIAQVAVTVIGFGGIVLAIGNRAISTWTAEEWFSLYALIVPTLTAFFCSFVPILTGLLIKDLEIVWRISNAVLGMLHLTNIAVFFLNPKKTKFTPGQKINGAIGLSVIIAHLLAATAVLPWFVFIFIFGLLQQIWIGIYNFILLFEPNFEDAA